MRKNRKIRSDLRPRQVWNLWMLIIKHDENTPIINGRKPYGSDLELFERLVGLGYFETRETDKRHRWTILENIRSRIKKHEITLESEIDFGKNEVV